jgi:1,4-dihydroxy-2-naphthoyl-CoA hydrolase
MHYEHVVTVRFNEVDRAGIAFFGRVFEYCHACFEETLAASGQPLLAIFEHGGYGLPLVHAEADYTRPMRLGERLLVTLRVARLGGRSITFAYEVRGAQDKDLRATVRLVHAFVRLDGFAGMAVPDALRDALAGLGLLEDAADTSG